MGAPYIYDISRLRVNGIIFMYSKKWYISYKDSARVEIEMNVSQQYIV